MASPFPLVLGLHLSVEYCHLPSPQQMDTKHISRSVNSEVMEQISLRMSHFITMEKYIRNQPMQMQKCVCMY